MRDSTREALTIAIGAAIILVGLCGGLALVAYVGLHAWGVYQNDTNVWIFSFQTLGLIILYATCVGILSWLAAVVAPRASTQAETAQQLENNPLPTDWELRVTWNNRADISHVKDVLSDFLEPEAAKNFLTQVRTYGKSDNSLYADAQTIQRIAREIKSAGMDADIIPYDR